MLTIIPEVYICAGAVLTAVSRPFDVHLTSTAMKLIYFYTFDKYLKDNPCILYSYKRTHCIKKTLTVLCTLLCESGDRVKVDKSLFSADLHAVMLRHHCLEYAQSHDYNYSTLSFS